MKNTLEAVRKLLKEKISDSYAFKCGVICIDTFAATALLDLVEKELDGLTSKPGKALTAPTKVEP